MIAFAVLGTILAIAQAGCAALVLADALRGASSDLWGLLAGFAVLALL